MLTHTELHEKIIEQIAEVDLLDLLEISVEELVGAFPDKIEEAAEKIIAVLDL